MGGKIDFFVGLSAIQAKLDKVLVSPYAVRQGVSLSTKDVIRYDPDLIITKEEEIIAILEVTKYINVNEIYRLRLSKLARNLGCSFFLIYCYDTQNIFIFDVRDEDLLGVPYEQLKDLDDFCGILYGASPLTPLQSEWVEALQQIIDNDPDIIKHRVEDAIRYLKGVNIQFDHVTKKCSVDSNDEHMFFKKILYPYMEDYICRYTTYASLERILKEKKQSVCSIVCMNDESECYYADGYIDKQRNENARKALITDYKELNDCQISSCTDIQMADKLSMWRMYGDNAKGVCLKFRINKDLLDSKHFYLYYVSYADEENKHRELDLIAKLREMKIGEYSFEFKTWYIWKHFFKPVHYKDEKEVRLLYFKQPGDKLKWIKAGEIMAPVIEFNIEKDQNEYPLVLSEIMLGPKFPEAQTNVVQIGYWKDLQGIKEEDSCMVVQSKIEGYR